MPPGQGRGRLMDYGSLLGYTINCRQAGDSLPDNLALKGVALRLGGTNAATVCFDTELLRCAAAWTGGFLDISQTHLDTYKGSREAFVAGELQFSTRANPGWLRGEEFADPRPLRAGNLPADWGKYKGLYRHGEQVVLAYSVNGVDVLEWPRWETRNGIRAFTRTFQVAPARQPLALYVCDRELAALRSTNAQTGNERITLPPSGRVVSASGKDQAGEYAVLNLGDPWRAVAVRRASSAARWHMAEERVELRLPVSPEPALFEVAMLTGARAGNWQAKLEEHLATGGALTDPQTLCQGGPARWPQPVATTGKLGGGDGAYVVDTLTLPEDNPWRSWLRLVAFDFFSDGRAAVSTWNGDVWIVSGVDDRLEKLTWKRFAAGLFEPLGLRIVDDTVYVCGRDQITRLRDLNGDGEADFYENFNNDAPTGPSYHAFAFELQTDRAGNFYFIRCGQRVDPALPLNGAMVKVSRDGTKAELFATGLRAANGMSIGPRDEITAADNQGNWVPSSRIDLIRPGRFYGYVPHARTAAPPADYEKPICWLPVALDNSSGSQAWITGDKWGPFGGQLVHTSYGKAALFLLMMETVAGEAQGGVVQFPLKFDSGIMRARFHPRDGQLYVCGLKGWQTAGARDGAFQRVRYTGRPVRLPGKLRVTSRGIEITFACPLDAASANDEQNYAVEQWNYRWTDKYGSPDYSVANPEKPGRDAVAIQSARLSPDRQTVRLEIPGIKPVMQMRIRFNIQAADGTPIQSELYHTINRVGAAE